MNPSYNEKAEKVRRSYEKLLSFKPGHPNATKDEVKDAYQDFFEDAYHLKDWIKNDDALKEEIQAKVEPFIKAHPEMKLLQAYATKLKHLKADHDHIAYEEVDITWDDGSPRGSPELGYTERGFLLTEDGSYLLINGRGDKLSLGAKPQSTHPWILTLKVLALWNQFFKDNGLAGSFKIVDDQRADYQE